MRTIQPIISIKNLDHYFGQGNLRRQVLNNINLEIMPGEVSIMTGPSGSGKTTLLTLVGGLRTVNEGSFKFLGQEMKNASEAHRTNIRRHIGYVFQHYNLLPFLTAEQNVRVSLDINSGVSALHLKERSEKILEAVNLREFCDYYPNQLSGGQKQRVSIARALVSQPQLILADEPTASLDSKSGRDIVILMRRLAYEQDCAILIVTHDNRILDIADRRFHMDDGYLVIPNK